jgi:DNA-binding CsgD family transcriptional regulator/tetratricopeptide (TPR) repeat protein
VSRSAAFVGRERELSLLQTAVAGEARLVLVVGDAGVGKTRFVGEGMRRLAGQMAWISGGCLPLGEKLPLLPVAEALGELAQLDGGELLEAALEIATPYVRVEAGRLLPQLGTGGEGPGRWGEWPRERLFAAVAELLGAAARRRGLGVLIEDVHWADGATLDLLTFLAWANRGGGVPMVVTCRSDEVPLDPRVAGWLVHARSSCGVEEIPLSPLSRREVAEHVSALAAGPALPRFVDDLYARAEGNPFFTEQLVAAVMAGPSVGGLSAPAGLPARLAELLIARADRCRGDARAVLDALAVAGRPLAETMLCSVTGLTTDVVRQGLRELAAARLLADAAPEGAHRPRHALLCEAVTGGLLPGERRVLHERIARALEAAGDETLAAEAAGHWAAAGRPAGELPARLAAADAAERVFGYAEAAAHWLRAIELSEALPGALRAPGAGLPRLYIRAIDALHVYGDRERAGEVAEEAYRRFADHPEPATAAVIHLRAAVLREYRRPAEALPLMEKALQLFERCPPSADKAEAWWRYAAAFLFHAEGRLAASPAALTRALEIAKAADAGALTARILSSLAVSAFLWGRVDEGFSLLDQASAMAEATRDDLAGLRLAATGSDALLTLGRFQDGVQLAQRGLHSARQAGIHSCLPAIFVAANAAEALMTLGRTAEAAALIDPLTAGPPRREHWAVHERRAQIDMLRGDPEAASRRQQQISSFSFIGSIDNSRRLAQDAGELALWAGRPGDALEEVQRALALFKAPDLTIVCGRLLGTGMRACADLAERARARQDHDAVVAALAAAGELVSWVDQMAGAPFTDHPYVAAIPAERASWDAERSRLAGASDPAAWSVAAKTWEGLGCPHRAAYAWWRHAEADLAAGQPPAAVSAAVQAATAASDGHAPLLAAIRALAQRTRIPLPTELAAPLPAEPPVPYGLTGRELAVLRLLADGRTNAQIGAELFISPKTAGVHVTNILRKLGVSGRVQAAALAERAGLLYSEQT